MWIRLPEMFPRWQPAPTTRAALWMLLSGLCAVLMNVLIRLAAQRMHPFEVAVFRCLFGLAVMAPFIIRAGPALFHNSRAVFFTLRSAVGLVSMLTWFYGITLVPLATATAVNFTAPLFATIGAALILHEDVRLRRWSAGAIGTIAHLSLARAYVAADASACAPFEFVRLPYAALIGYLMFGEVPDGATWLGAAIIAGAAMYVAYREATRRQARPRPGRTAGGAALRGFRGSAGGGRAPARARRSSGRA